VKDLSIHRILKGIMMVSERKGKAVDNVFLMSINDSCSLGFSTYNYRCNSFSLKLDFNTFFRVDYFDSF
jgi:hypothetical protein